MTRFLSLLLPVGLATLSCGLLPAADISPSRTTVPEKFVNPPGKRFSIFQGDPERVQKANQVRIEDFEADLRVEPSAVAQVAKGAADATPPTFDVVLSIRNKGKRAYTLSFPDAQRYDILIEDTSGKAVWVWSNDKLFVQEIGSSFVNGGERLAFRETVELSGPLAAAAPGRYKVTMILSNYPELKGTGEISILPAGSMPKPVVAPPAPRTDSDADASRTE